MDLFTNSKIETEDIFKKLYFAATEDEVDTVFAKYPHIFNNPKNWFPLGRNENNFGVIENQQSSPIASLIEKITNSIDALLMRKCLEARIDPKSSDAPKTMEDALTRFFPNSRNWDLIEFRKKQAESIQIVASGKKLKPSLVIYDDGEGQHPEDFEKTFLSLLVGNKNEIPFVQGKYNMGGSGAIVFCGKKRYQLIGSRKYDESGKFGFTLIRKHPLNEHERQTKKNTWYEYLKINGEIPAFEIRDMDLGLFNRRFKAGTIVKLYSYDLPEGSRSVISRDLNQSINEFLFEPALPLYTIDTKERYPDDRALQRELYGLKRRLEQENSKYVEDYFSEEFHHSVIGKMKVTCYVFKTKIDGKTAKESRESISREFFKNNMSVLFSVNGQVHGHYTSEFITRSLKFQLLKSHLLIHVDCTHMNYEFRTELFMASRDRLKDGDESRSLREELAKLLRKSRLADINKRRKDSISIEAGDTSELIKSFTKNLPLNSELMTLLNQTFKLEEKKEKPAPKSEKKKSSEKEKEPFQGKRFPTYFKLSGKNDGVHPVAKIPLGGDRTILFQTDAENQYFDRIEDPGEMQIALLNYEPNDITGGDKAGNPKKIEEVFHVITKSPNEGKIRIVLAPTENVDVGDAVQMKVSLDGAGETFDQIFWVKISDPEKPTEKTKPKEEPEEDKLGLPQYFLVYQSEKEDHLTWERFEVETGQDMDYKTVMHPYVEGDLLERIYINMDSSTLKNYKSKIHSEEQMEIADKRYISTVYFHTLFLYTITKKRNYSILQQQNGKDETVDLTDYLKDLFGSYYSAFLLNFGVSELMAGLE